MKTVIFAVFAAVLTLAGGCVLFEDLPSGSVGVGEMCTSSCPEGPPGPQGEVGPAGLEGPRGETGPMGPTGKDGMDGAPGMDGLPGTEGPEGPMGPAGMRGPTGDPGLAGPEGPPGPPGAMCSFEDDKDGDGAYDWVEILASTDPALGSDYPADLNGDGIYDVFVGPEGPMGATGPEGPAGPMGPVGEAGSPGPTGLMGPEGPQGPPGEPALLGCPVGTVEMLVGTTPAYCIAPLPYPPLLLTWPQCVRHCAEQGLSLPTFEETITSCIADPALFPETAGGEGAWYWLAGSPDGGPAVVKRVRSRGQAGGVPCDDGINFCDLAIAYSEPGSFFGCGLGSFTATAALYEGDAEPLPAYGCFCGTEPRR